MKAQNVIDAFLDFDCFQEEIRDTLFFGSLPHWQRTPVRSLLREGLIRERNWAEIAYALATAYHETGRFRWMSEIGEGEGRPYGDLIYLTRRQQVAYYGRGYVQLTWLRNYAVMGERLGLPLVVEPDRAKDPEVAAMILWEGMIDGMFTGVAFSDVANGSETLDFVEARRIINGTDRADDIADIASRFLHALLKAVQRRHAEAEASV
ncbi:MAG: hypothetical protein AAF899_06765 [Pseudomonadota bacterium]